jgi:O-antigen/teichoic acid export membrane protein
MKTLAVKLLNGQLGKGLAQVVGEPKSLRFRLARDTVGVMVIQAISMGLTFATSVVLARLLGVQEFGLYSLGMSVLGLLVVPATLGFPQLLVREIAAYRVKDDWNLIQGLLRFAQRTSLLASIVIALLGSLFLWLLAGHFSEEAMQVLILAFVALPFWALLELQGASLRGFEQILAGQWASSAMRPLCFLLMVGTFWLFFGRIANASLALGLHILATGVALAFAFYLLRSQLHCSVPSSVESQNTAVWIRSSLSLALLTLLNLISQYMGILMLGWMRSAEEVGLYKAAYQTASVIPFAMMAVNLVISPSMSQLHTLGDRPRLRRLVILATGMSLAFAVPFVVMFTGGGSWFLEQVFGAEFVPAASPLVILTVASLVQITCGSLWQMLLMVGYEKSVALITAIGTGMHLIASAVFIPRWGPQGAAAAMIAYFAPISVLTFLLVYVKRII